MYKADTILPHRTPFLFVSEVAVLDDGQAVSEISPDLWTEVPSWRVETKLSALPIEFQKSLTSFNTEGMRNSNACEAVAFDAAVMAASRSVRRMERSSALILSAFDEALAMSGLDPKTVMPERGSAAFGTTLGGSCAGFDFYRSFTRENRRRPSLLRDYSLGPVKK